jgi:hypothetical protein
MTSKTRKQSISKKCDGKFCKKFVDYALKFSDSFLKGIENIPDKTEMQQKLVKTMKSKKYKNILTQKAKRECKQKFCNIGCKNTIFEDGNELPKSIIKEYKDYPPLIDLMKKAKKDLFGNKQTVLKDNFYYKLNTNKINSLKKEGALSACVKTEPKF